MIIYIPNHSHDQTYIISQSSSHMYHIKVMITHTSYDGHDYAYAKSFHDSTYISHKNRKAGRKAFEKFHTQIHTHTHTHTHTHAILQF